MAACEGNVARVDTVNAAHKAWEANANKKATDNTKWMGVELTGVEWNVVLACSLGKPRTLLPCGYL